MTKELLTQWFLDICHYYRVRLEISPLQLQAQLPLVWSEWVQNSYFI